jgi:hypothetical protein
VSKLLPNREKLRRLLLALSQCDEDCESREGGLCDCGAMMFREKLTKALRPEK